MPISRRVVACATAAVCAVAVTACSSGSSGSGSSGLEQAMGSVSGAGAAKTDFQYGDMKRLRQLGIVDAKRKVIIDARWQDVVGYGAGSFIRAAFQLPKVIAVDLFAADTTVQIGTAPNTAIRISGAIDKPAVTAKLKALGAKPHTFGGTSGLSLAADNKISVTGPLANTGLVNEINQVVLADNSMTSSPNGATLQQALDTSPSLLDTGGYRDLANCLGDVIVAHIAAAPPSDKNAAVFAVGVRNPSSKSGVDHEVLCALPRDGKSAALRAALGKNLSLSATDPDTHAPISNYATKSEVGSSGDAVKVVLTMKSAARVGFLMESMLRGLLPVWDGTCQPQTQATQHC